MNEEVLKKQAILNNLLSTCEIISTENHRRATIAQMRIEMYRNRLSEARIWNIDELAYEIIEWVNTFLENNL